MIVRVLTWYDYQLVYRPGKSNGQGDALTRRPGDLSEGGDETWKNMEQGVLKPQNLPEQLHLLFDYPLIRGCPSISDPTTAAYRIDPL